MTPEELIANDVGAVIHPATEANAAILIEWPNGMRASLYTGSDTMLVIGIEPAMELDVNTL